ncbi:MAG: AEC family transporter [Oscillospiraceae bacterium]|jgi:predicted permease|nr:AEC family transporter [Oscillospiraceae bacterium]
MLENLVVVAGQVLTLFIMMGVGFTMRKTKRLADETLSQMTYLLLHIVAPCIIVDSLQLERDMSLLLNIGITAACAAGYFGFTIIVSYLTFRRTEPDTRDVLRFGMVYPNNGFMGFPLIRACLGEGAMLFASIFLVVFSLAQWTHGILLMDKSDGKKSGGIGKALLNPGTIGFVAGFILFILNFKLPEPIGNSLKLLGDINSPLAMVVIGAQIADADILKLFKQGALYLASALKLVIFPAITAVALWPLHLPVLLYCTVVILAGTPSAAVTAMFAKQFNRDAQTGARLVSLSTLLSILTLPILAAIIKSV